MSRCRCIEPMAPLASTHGARGVELRTTTSFYCLNAMSLHFFSCLVWRRDCEHCRRRCLPRHVAASPWCWTRCSEAELLAVLLPLPTSSSSSSARLASTAMATPHRSLHKSRSGILRAEAGTSTPTSSSPLARSSSTPYHLYAASKGGEVSSPSSYAHSPSPFISGSPYASSSRLGGTRAAFGAGAAHSPVRRKGTSFGSPGMKATSAGSGVAGAGSSAAPSPSMLVQRPSGRKSNAFIRRKTWQQK